VNNQKRCNDPSSHSNNFPCAYGYMQQYLPKT